MDYQTSEGLPKAWYALGVIVILAAVAFWYYTKDQSPEPQAIPGNQAAEEQPPAESGTSYAAITADVNQIPDDSAALTADESVSAQAVQSL